VTTRRYAALALAASLLNLNVVRADVACSQHERATAGHETADHEMHHDDASATAMAHGAHALHHSEPLEQPGKTPTQPSCCQALASCSLAFGSDAGSAIVAFVLTHDVGHGALIDAPRSRVTTPDPPPPKA
jgi:hypothetical protein